VSAPRILVSRFRRLYAFATHAFTSVGTKGTPATLDSNVALDLRFLQRTRGHAGRNVKSATLALAFALLTAATTGAFADAADFYRGKTLRILVGYGTGTGYDVYARLLGRHIGRHLAGAPTVVIQNMPGAASLTMVNYMYNVAPRDGSAIGLPARGLFIEPLFGNDNAKFEARKFTWLGSMSRDVATCFTWHTSGIATLDDAKKREVLVGSSGVNGSSHQLPTMVNAFLGTKFKPLLGYVDSAGVGLAMERGELEGYCSFTWASIKSARPTWIAQKQINILLQLSLTKHAELAQVPTAMDLAKDEAARQAFALVVGDQEMGRPVFAPPDVPAERVDALRAAFDATMKDPEFLADAARLSIEIDPIDARAVEQVLARLYATPQAVIDRVKEIYAGQ
jgi:tripartite-type tricarboxylate transporter receptor subunit TctC